MATSAAIGMNLAAVTYWGTEAPFIDRMKTAGDWAAQNWSGGTTGAITLNADGYPVGMPANSNNVYTMVALDPPSAGTSNTYVLSYKGTATVALTGAKIISSKPGEIVFQYTGTGATAMQQIMLFGLNTNDPIGDMHLVRQDQVALFKQGEIFNPAFTDKITAFDTLRYMDWSNTNGSDITNWADRTTVSDMSWQSTQTKSGVPIEVMVALANKTHTNMWLDVPTQANDDYVRKTLAYVRDNLDPTLKVSIEYSNEVWNWGFNQAHFAQDMANKLWGKDLNGNGAIDAWTSESVEGGNEVYYGYRSAQIAAIANQVFGSQAASRVNTVLATQTVHQGLEDYIFQGVEKAGVGSVSALFDSYAITTYFGFSTTESDKATILRWAHSGAAGIAAAFKELETGGTLSSNFSIARLLKDDLYQAAIADKYGLDLITYEGGISLVATDFAEADQADVVAFFSKLSADPRMGVLYAKMASDFSSAGGVLLNAFQDAGFDSKYGTWGTLKSIYDDTSPAYAALVQAAADARTDRTTASVYTFGQTERNISYTGSGTFTAIGNDLGNEITGGKHANRLAGGGGADTLTGGRDADYLDGGTGADRMVGRGGDDIYIVDSVGDVVVEEANGGSDEVRTSLASYTLASNVETLTYVGVGGFAGTGNALDNVITGGAGNDVLDGGAGKDVMTGGAGDDVYVVDNAGDSVIELAGGGNDEVRTTLARYTLPANVEKLTFVGTGNFAGTGNAANNAITGGSGNDTLDGGGGADVLVGGSGNDIYIVDSIADVVTELADQGIDEVRTSLSTYTLMANVEKLTFTGTGAFTGKGNALNNTIVGGSGADTLDGGAGADVMTGGGGDDVYIVDNSGDTVVEAANGGIDTVRTSLASYNLAANVENIIFTGTGAFTSSGSASDNVMIGSSTGVNTLFGGDGNDILVGGAFNDVFYGGTGADRMVGGLGDDRYVVDNVGDLVAEDANGGNDGVNASISYTLGANVENLYLVGTDAINGTGNALANTIQGNDAANTLSGGGGNDYLTGGGGDDILLGGDGADSLVGGAGNDTLTGGAGADSLSGGTGADRFVFAPGDLGASAGAADYITDFSRSEGDKIDISAFDAITRSATNEAFSFIGTAAFTKHAGELRVDTSGNFWLVQGDVNGDGIADFALCVSKGSGALIASDFIL